MVFQVVVAEENCAKILLSKLSIFLPVLSLPKHIHFTPVDPIMFFFICRPVYKVTQL